LPDRHGKKEKKKKEKQNKIEKFRYPIRIETKRNRARIIKKLKKKNREEPKKRGSEAQRSSNRPERVDEQARRLPLSNRGGRDH
jgi:hypothetical protein